MVRLQKTELLPVSDHFQELLLSYPAMAGAIFADVRI